MKINKLDIDELEVLIEEYFSGTAGSEETAELERVAGKYSSGDFEEYADLDGDLRMIAALSAYCREEFAAASKMEPEGLEGRLQDRITSLAEKERRGRRRFKHRAWRVIATGAAAATVMLAGFTFWRMDQAEPTPGRGTGVSVVETTVRMSGKQPALADSNDKRGKARRIARSETPTLDLRDAGESYWRRVEIAETDADVSQAARIGLETEDVAFDAGNYFSAVADRASLADMLERSIDDAYAVNGIAIDGLQSELEDGFMRLQSAFEKAFDEQGRPVEKVKNDKKTIYSI